MDNNSAEYTDITAAFRERLSSLKVGEMVHSDSFRIEDSMSSIELMEPKMDPGYANRARMAEREKSKHDITDRIFEPSESCRIADTLIGQLYLWLDGHIYIQTVHASMFMIHRNELRNDEIKSFCDSLLGFCSTLRTFMTPTGVCDEEDYVGYMFGFEKECARSKPPQLVDPQLSLRFQFIDHLSNLLSLPSDDLSLISTLIDKLQSICSDLRGSPSLSDSAAAHIIESSSDPHYHRSLLPPGPPRVVPPVPSTDEIYCKWSKVFASLFSTIQAVDGDNFLRDPSLSPFVLFNRLRTLRQDSQFSLVRAFTFHRVYYSIMFPALMSNWIGDRSMKFFTKYLDKKEVENFMNDLASVLGRIIHTFHRTTSRQHRAFKHVLADLSILQQVAWDFHTQLTTKKIPPEFSGLSKTLWCFVVLLGSTLIQDNLLLNFELDLVDLFTIEPALIYFFSESVTSVKLFVLNEMMSKRMVSLPFLAELRNETITTAIEHSASQALYDMFRVSTTTTNIDAENLARLFELRSISIRAFILPKSVGVEDFLKLEKFGTSKFQCLDECLSWIDRAVKEFPSDRIDGSLIARNVTGIKKSLLTSKMTLLKRGGDNQATKTTQFEHRFHPLVPNLVSS